MDDYPDSAGETSRGDFEARESGDSFWSHLSELRNRLLACVLVFFCAVVVSWLWRDELFLLVTAPVIRGLSQHGIYRLTAIETTEAILIYLKMAVVAGLLVSVPFTLFQLWRFVAPGLKPSEIRPIRRVVVLSLFMFALGLLFAHRFVLPLVVDFLTGFTLSAGNIELNVTLRSAYSTALTFLAGFGVIFQLPLAMVLLASTPLADHRRYLKWFRYFVVISFVLGSLLTPPDVLSQVLMAVPLCILYLVGVLATWFMERRRSVAPARQAGFDFVLPVMATLLAAGIVWLSWPEPRNPMDYLPPGPVLLVRSTQPGLPSLCPSDQTGEALSSASTCIRYESGFLTLAEEDGKTPGSLDAVVQGTPRLVSLLAHRMENESPQPGPYSALSHLPFVLYRTFPASGGEEPSWILVGLPFDPTESIQIILSFSSSGLAHHFAGMVKHHPQDLEEPHPVSSESDSQRQAVSSLLSALETLQARHPELAESLSPHLQAARKALPAPALSPDESSILECSSAYCVAEVACRHLGTPTDVVPNRRTVELTFPRPGNWQEGRLPEWLVPARTAAQR
jgi:sec-independent protein translocase protein TatC